MPLPNNFNINSRTIGTPIVAFTMASLLFVYTRTSIKSAKRNAQLHREADGGQISWKNENSRRHGQFEKIEDSRTDAEVLADELAARKLKRSGKGG